MTTKICRYCKHWTIEKQVSQYLLNDQDGRCDKIVGHNNGISITVNGDATHEMTTNAIFGCNLWSA